jgi:hypothetical protein
LNDELLGQLDRYWEPSGATRSRVLNLALRSWLDGDKPTGPLVYEKHEPDPEAERAERAEGR